MRLLWVAFVVAGCAVVWACVAHLRATRITAVLAAERQKAESLECRLEVVSGLLQAGRAVNSARDLDQVLDTILAGAVGMLGANTGSVMLVRGDQLVGVAAVGNDRAVGGHVRIGEGIAGQVAATRQPLLINGTASPRTFPGLGPRSIRVHSAVSVPMVERGELIGVLNVGAPASHRFDEDDLSTASAFAEYAAAAIAKARLYDARRRQTEELAYQASHDALTGLPNRSKLRDTVVRAGGRRSSAVGGALLFVDLDGFKAVNDLLGHAGGDVLLEAVARRITGCVSSEDIAARVGGDEFAVFVSSAIDVEAAGVVADRIVDRLSEPFVVQQEVVRISASVGIALLKDAERSFDELMHAADRALYAAKGAGKNRWHASDTGIVPRPRVALPETIGDAQWA